MKLTSEQESKIIDITGFLESRCINQKIPGSRFKVSFTINPEKNVVYINIDAENLDIKKQLRALRLFVHENLLAHLESGAFSVVTSGSGLCVILVIDKILNKIV